MDNLTYIQSTDEEPDWCANGSYLAYRKVQQNLRAFLKRDLDGKEKLFGIDKRSGQRLPRRPYRLAFVQIAPESPRCRFIRLP